MTTMVMAGTTGRREGVLGTRTEPAGHVAVAKNLLLFLAAPWIGLAYIIALPFVGFAVLAKAAVLRH